MRYIFDQHGLLNWLKKHALELFDIERFSKMACMYFFSKVLICSGWFNRPNLASFAAHFPSSTNYMYMYSVSSSQLTSPFSTEHTSLFIIFRFSSVEAVLHLTGFTTASSCGRWRIDSLLRQTYVVKTGSESSTAKRQVKVWVSSEITCTI